MGGEGKNTRFILQKPEISAWLAQCSLGADFTSPVVFILARKESKLFKNPNWMEADLRIAV